MGEGSESDRPEVLPATTNDAASFGLVIAQAVEPFVREQRIADVEKARLDVEAHK